MSRRLIEDAGPENSSSGGETLADGEGRLAAILDTAVEAILTIDERGVIESINPSGCRLFGYEPAELIGRNVSCLMPEPDRSEHDQHLARYCEGGEPHVIGIGREVVGRRKDGSRFPAHLSVSEVRLSTRRMFTGFLRDLTELKIAQEQLVQSERLAAIGEAMAGLAHESRNALQRSQMCLDLLDEKVGHTEDAQELVASIQRSLDDLHRLYEEVRAYAAPMQLQPGATDLRELVLDAWDELHTLRGGRDARLEFTMACRDLTCEADAFSLRKVFRNVLENSLQACPDPVEIGVRCGETTLDDCPAISVTVLDNGPGIPKEIGPQVFDSFFSTKPAGTGLGMAIAHRIVAAHGGRIGLSDRPTAADGPRGAEFVIQLPRRQS